MDTLLEAIDVCDVDGFCYGNYTDEEAGTGCTVIVAPEGATGGVDVRGGAPASRETDLLRPENTVDKVHAVCLSGGSAFGLEAASGVARELESRGIGLPVEGHLWSADKNWGYIEFKTRKDVTDRYVTYAEKLMELVERGFSAAVYTQTTDVEGEVNGLVPYDREVVKVDVDRLHEVNRRLVRSLDL